MLKSSQRSSGRLEAILAVLISFGVLTAAAMALTGCVLWLIAYGKQPAELDLISGAGPGLDSVIRIISMALKAEPEALMQLGLVILLLTPLVRVAVSFGYFVVARDRIFTGLTAAVLIVLLAGLVW